MIRYQDEPDPCKACGRPLVAAKSRRTGLCAGCHAQADSALVEAGQLVHAEDCPGARVREHETARRQLLVCAGCGAHAYRPRVTRWGQ